MSERTRQVTAPRPREPMPAETLPDLRGRVVILLGADLTWGYGYMAFSDVHTCSDFPCVTVVPARQYWAYELLGALPTGRLHWPAGCVFAV